MLALGGVEFLGDSLHCEVGLVLHLGQDVFVEVNLLAEHRDGLFFQVAPQVCEIELIALLKLAILGAVPLDSVVGQVHEVVCQVLVGVVGA